MRNIPVKQVARELGIDARILRKFLRSDASSAEPVGQGNRYMFNKKGVKKLKKEFLQWNSDKSTLLKKVKPRVITISDDGNTMDPRQDAIQDLDDWDDILTADDYEELAELGFGE